MKVCELNKMIDLAKNRNDGVFSKGGYYYAVKDKSIYLIGSKITGEIVQPAYGFVANIGKVKAYEVRDKLKELLRKGTTP